MTLVGPGTWEAARAAVDCALTAVDLVAGGAARRRTRCAGRPATTSPAPGTAAPATSTTPPSPPQALRDAGHARVAVVDLDAHHGNGTQAIFWERADVRYGSPTSTPAPAGSRTSSATPDETGAGDGDGATLNLPLRRGHRRRPVARGASRRSPSAPPAPTRWSSRSASTPPPTTRRARSWSPPTATPRPGACSGRSGVPSGARPGGRLPPATASAAWSRRTSTGTTTRRLASVETCAVSPPWSWSTRAAGCCSRSATSGARSTPRVVAGRRRHRAEGESDAEAALRELEEETGLTGIDLDPVGSLPVLLRGVRRDPRGGAVHGFTALTDADVVCHEGRQIVFVDPTHGPHPPLEPRPRAWRCHGSSATRRTPRGSGAGSRTASAACCSSMPRAGCCCRSGTSTPRSTRTGGGSSGGHLEATGRTPEAGRLPGGRGGDRRPAGARHARPFRSSRSSTRTTARWTRARLRGAVDLTDADIDCQRGPADRVRRARAGPRLDLTMTGGARGAGLPGLAGVRAGCVPA